MTTYAELLAVSIVKAAQSRRNQFHQAAACHEAAASCWAAAVALAAAPPTALFADVRDLLTFCENVAANAEYAATRAEAQRGLTERDAQSLPMLAATRAAPRAREAARAAREAVAACKAAYADDGVNL